MTELKYKVGDEVYCIRRDDKDNGDLGWDHWNDMKLTILAIQKDNETLIWPYEIKNPVTGENGLFKEEELSFENN